MNKKKILTIVLVLMVLLLGGASVYVATQLSTRETVAPTAPESKPKADEPTPPPIVWKGSEECTVTAVASATDCVPSGVITCDPDCPTACGKAASTITTCTDSCGTKVSKECPATEDCTTEVEVTREVTRTVTVVVTRTVTPSATLTIAPTRTASIAATPTVLPEAGIFDLPGVIAFGGGLLLAVVGILLAL